MSVNDMVTIDLADVAADGTVTHAALPQPLSAEARFHTRALRYQRLAATLPTRDTTALFRYGDRAITTALRQAARDLQVPLNVSRWRTGRRNDRWQHNLADAAYAFDVE